LTNLASIERLVLGTAQFGLPYGITNNLGQISLQEASGILCYSKGIGIKNIDTAISYGNSEQILGSIGVSDWNITTKLPRIPKNCVDIIDWINSSINDALKRLGIDQFDSILLHRPNDLLENNGENIYRQLQEAKRLKLVRKIGISVYDLSELNIFKKGFIFDSVQLPLNIFDRRLLSSNVVTQLKNTGVEVQARSIFLQGLLLLKPEEIPIQFKKWNSLWKEWHQWLNDNSLSALRACLGFVFSQPVVDKVIIGVSSIRELKEIVPLIDASIPDIPLSIQSTDINLIDPRSW